MAKESHQFVCQECGHSSIRWLGRCRSVISGILSLRRLRQAASTHPRLVAQPASDPAPITRISASESDRQLTGIGEFDRVLGGGIVRGLWY